MRISDWSSDVCSSDLLKTQVIIPELRRRFAGLPIVNVTGVRAEESATRARLAIADKEKKSTPSQPLWNWRPILHWKLHDVLDTIRRDRQRVVTGKSVSVSVDLGGNRILSQKKNNF